MQQSALYRSIKVLNNDLNKDLPSQPKLLKSRSSSKNKIHRFLLNSSSQINTSPKKIINQSSPNKLSSNKLLIQKHKDERHDEQDKTKIQQRNKLPENGLNKSLKSVKNKIIFQAFPQERPYSENDSIYKYLISNGSRQSKQFGHQNQRSLQYSEQQRKSDDTEMLLYKISNWSNEQKGQSASIKQSSVQSHHSESRQKPQNTVNSRSKSKLIKKQTLKQSQEVDNGANTAKHSTSPQFMIENKFYHYCAQQIVDLALESRSAEQNMKRLHEETQIIREKNVRLEHKIEIQKHGLKQLVLMEKQLQAKALSLSRQLSSLQQKTVQQLPSIYKQTYKQQYNEHKQDIQTKTSQIKQQQACINQLKLQLDQQKHHLQELSVIDEENELLKQQIQNTRRKRLDLDNNLYRKNRLISHLQQIKDLEFENLIENFSN